MTAKFVVVVAVMPIRWTILTCAQKLTSSQLSMPHGTEQKRIMKKLKQTRRCSEEMVRHLLCKSADDIWCIKVEILLDPSSYQFMCRAWIISSTVLNQTTTKSGGPWTRGPCIMYCGCLLPAFTYKLPNNSQRTCWKYPKPLEIPRHVSC